jgi:hypothetical protein
MRTKVALCVLAAFAMSSPAMAAIGAINWDLTSGGSDADIILAQGVGAVIPVEVSFSTDVSGTSGSNRGAAGMAFSLDTGLPLVDQSPLAIPFTVTNPHNFITTASAGLGFSSFVDGGSPSDLGGDAAKETIDAVGAFQGLSPDFDFRNAMGIYKHGSMAENVGTGVANDGGEAFPGPILFADGTVTVAPGTPAGTYVMTVIPKSAKVWDTTPGEAVTIDVPGIGDTLTIIIVPEPATMLLLAPAAWVLRRRRKAKA